MTIYRDTAIFYDAKIVTDNLQYRPILLPDYRNLFRGIHRKPKVACASLRVHH